MLGNDNEKTIVNCKKCGRPMSVPVHMLTPHTRNDRLFGRKVWCGACNTIKFYKLEEGRATL